MTHSADVIVIGGGVVGLWTAYHLTAQNKKTILLEQFPYPHSRGSSHGQTRIIRTAYCDEEYSAMMPESYRKWRMLETETGKSLLLRAGLVTMFNMDDSNDVHAFDRMRTNLEKYASCEVINGADVCSRFPGLYTVPGYSALYDEGAGVLMADKCLLALRELYLKRGGILCEHERVVSIRSISDVKVEVVSSERVYRCESTIVTAGAYTNAILSATGLELPLNVRKAPVLYWRDKSLTQKYSLKKGFPSTSVYMGNSFYSIPSYEYPGMMKICHEALITVDPTRRNALTTKEKAIEEERMNRLKERIKEHFPDIDTSDPVFGRIASSLYCGSTVELNIYYYIESYYSYDGISFRGLESGPIICPILEESDPAFSNGDALLSQIRSQRTPDWRFIIDRHPEFRNVVIGAGFSAHGFKTAPAVGGMLANMAIGLEPSYPLEPFSIDRFKKSKL